MWKKGICVKSFIRFTRLISYVLSSFNREVLTIYRKTYDIAIFLQIL